MIEITAVRVEPMIKQVALVTAKAGMTRDAFIDRYENGHAVLALRIVPFFCDYRRNYVIPNSMISTGHLGSTAPVNFTGITEFWLAGQKEVDELDRALRAGVGDQIVEDETHLFDRSKITTFQTDEFLTPDQELAIRPSSVDGRPAVKLFFLARRNEAIARDAFVAGYEDHYTSTVLNTSRVNRRPLIAGFRRSYPVAGSPFQHPHIEFKQTLDFDVMTEIWFWTENDFKSFLALTERPNILGELNSCAESLLQSRSIQAFLVDEYVTPEHQLSAHAS
jgi:hypothetical protein